MQPAKEKMLITGVSGLLGNNLAYFFREKFQILGLYREHPVFIEGVETRYSNLLSEKSIFDVVKTFHPNVVIHCASLTNVDDCEKHKDMARAVNVLGTQFLVNAVQSRNDCKLVFISTDLVYDGKKGDYRETDPVNPVNFYGISKLEAEQEALRKEKALVLRTNIFGWNIQDKLSLAEWMLNELSQGRPIQGFRDVLFSSIYTFELAKILGLAIEKDLSGIYNCGSSTSLSKYEFALKLAEIFSLDSLLIRPISIDDSCLTAKRAKNISLNVDKLNQDLPYRTPSVAESLVAFHRDYQKRLPQEIKRKRRGDVYPQTTSIPYGRQSVDDADIASVVQVLKSSNLTQGGKIAEFELAMCQYTGARYAVAVNSGTSALHITCLAAGIQSGDQVITSPNTFVASANCIVYCGATPVFSDIDEKTYNVSSEGIQKAMGSSIRGVIPVHFAGQSCSMDAIQDVVKQYERKLGRKIYIIEDASHALGSFYKGSPVGSCSFSDMVVMSFHPVKHITTGEGGMVLTNNEELYKKLKLLRSHGITGVSEEFENRDMAFCQESSAHPAKANPWYYEQIDLGYNYRITDIQCALGLSQLKKLEGFKKRRRDIVNKYNAAFLTYSHFVHTPFEDKKGDANFHLYVLLFDFDRLGIDRAQMMRELKAREIYTQVHYIPVHLHPYYRKRFDTRWGLLPNAERYYSQCLSIPLYPDMSDADVDTVIGAVKDLTKNEE